MSHSFLQPSYLALYRSGELQTRADLLESRLADCDLCPHLCHVNRLEGEIGFCRSGAQSIVCAVCDHHGEEPPVSGEKGSGTIFFGNCTMRCVYCQNYQISQNPRAMNGKEMDARSLAVKMLFLQNDLGCHNINLVSPTHFVPQIVRAVLEAVPMGLRVPLVYNTGGYETVETLKLLEGIIDIYLPDIRYADNEIARKYSHVKGYVEANRAAIEEMYRQVGNLKLDNDGVAKKGLIMRHLILPEGLAGSEASLAWLAEEISPEAHLSIMAQYYPAHRAPRYPALTRRINIDEYNRVMGLLERLGMENGWFQELDAPDSYQPDFTREGNPFTRENLKPP